MIKSIMNDFKNLDNTTFKIMIKGFHFCLILAIISSLILFTYSFLMLSPFVYYIGFSLLKLSIYFTIEFIVCGFVVDNIKNSL